LQLLRRDDADDGVVDVRAGERVTEGAVPVLLARGRVAEGDVGVERRVLEAGRGLDRRDDLPRDAELGEAAERRVLVRAKVAHRLVEPDEPFLDEIVGVTAGDEVRARLQADEAGVAAEKRVHGGAVPVPGTEDEP
jgi:hypothetical protein